MREEGDVGMSTQLEEQRQYIASLDLSSIPRPVVEQDADTEAGEIFAKTKDQAQVVGSGVFSFATGVDEDVRQAICDSALLAQLVADKRANSERDPLAWFEVYSEVLKNTGWVVQEKMFDDYTTRGSAAEVHDKIIEVMTAVLGPAPATLLILAATVKALKGIDPKSSWMRIFGREAQKANVGRFQIGLVETDRDGEVFVSMLACLMEAQQTVTRILFFKWRDAHAMFRARVNKVSINRRSLKDLHRQIVDKTRAYQDLFFSSIQDI
jgi:hypothetical protein